MGSFSRHKMSTDGLESCELLVDYYVFYQLSELSFWRHPFTESIQKEQVM